jgi:hypothetical protein
VCQGKVNCSVCVDRSTLCVRVFKCSVCVDSSTLCVRVRLTVRYVLTAAL